MILKNEQEEDKMNGAFMDTWARVSIARSCTVWDMIMPWFISLAIQGKKNSSYTVKNDTADAEYYDKSIVDQ